MPMSVITVSKSERFENMQGRILPNFDESTNRILEDEELIAAFLYTQQLKITVALVFGIISFILFKFTMFGKHCRAIGSRLEVCRQSGVRVKLVQYGSYVFTGLASGLVAFFFLIRSGAANIGTASNLEFNALQALMLGGVLITGGSSVKFRSAVIGSITMAALANGMTLWGVETLTQQLIKGFIFLIVIALTFERKSVEVIK